jgi:hypothetical protein
MDLLERYLAEVRRNLPTRDADDIIAELRDVLTAKAEEQEEATGSVDWNALLQDFGHPLVIAARYGKRQWLIGPELYPFYWHFLKMVVGIVLLVVTAFAIVRGMLWETNVGHGITAYLSNLWWAAASSIGSVTIVFALLDRFGGKSAKECRTWKPLELPEVEQKQPSIYESTFEVGAGILLLLWWFGFIPTPQFGQGFRLIAAPVWQPLFWPVAALLASQLAFNLIRWLRPRWTGARGGLGAINAVGALAIALVAYRAGRWVTVVSTGMSAQDASGLRAALDLAFRIGAVVMVVVFVLNMAADMWRKLQRSRSQGSAQPVRTA